MSKYIYMAMIIIILVLTSMFLWQRVTVARQKGEINILTEAKTNLEGQIQDYKVGIEKAKKAAKAQQAIADNAVSMFNQIKNMKEGRCILDEDEKNISNITSFFNDRGLLFAGDSKANGKELPATNKTNIDRPHWSAKQVIENYLTVIDYSLKLEKMVECYETTTE